MKDKDPEIKIISRNRKAHLKFSILESYEAGLVLTGHEVKALRDGKCSIDESMVRVDAGEAYLWNAYIPPYRHLSHIEYDPSHRRKLLLHKKELKYLESEAQIKGVAIVPLELYFKGGIAKVAIGLAKGKKFEDRREEVKKRESDLEIRRKFAR